MSNHITWHALDYLKTGLSVFPLAENSKRPASSWERYQQQPATRQEAQAWQACNLGIVTGAVSGLVVVDCESEDDARWFMTYRSAGLLPGLVKTPRGVHLYYRHPGQKVKNAQRITDSQGQPRYDIRGDGGYVVAPPSQVDGQQYHWLREFWNTKELPEFRPAWRPEQTAGPTSKPSTGQQSLASSQRPAVNTERQIKDPAAYISHITAISGQAGHSDTWRAVNRLRDAGLTEPEALELLREWNETNAHPPWSERELRWKVQDCYSR